MRLKHATKLLLRLIGAQECKAFRLVPRGSGRLSLDGEAVPFQAIQIWPLATGYVLGAPKSEAVWK